MKQQRKKAQQQGYRHKCEVCGRTDTDFPDLQFRYCSKCAGYHCFCEDHIFNTHILRSERFRGLRPSGRGPLF
ncbi:MAG: hypothetical protein EP146_01495 [Oscillibacter sp.]|uniref:hypothetical protein n=1 Tax=Oscillibacter sp. TaxID=1945593 RepID=UPI0013295DAE|nr:hypothetical protein [Oscillibacter sp.]MUU10198.1 hypothetical protein [Oscillibacter sp.]